MRLIDAYALSRAMYHEAFETDSDWQRWDSGLWIRYKMFENALKNAPTIDAVPVVRCGECKYYFPYKHYDGRILGYHCQAPNQQTDFLEPTHYCGFGERKADDHI